MVSFDFGSANMGGLPRWPSGKESPANAGATGDAGLIPGLGRPPGGGKANLLQDSCWDNPMGCSPCACRVRHD